MLIWDLETDNLLENVTKLHCGWTYNTRTGEWRGYRPDTVYEMWKDLAADDDGLVAHNGLGYDLEVLKKLQGHEPGFQEWYDKCHAEVGTYFIDTLILSRLLYPDVGQMDWAQRKKGRSDMAVKLIGSHSLKAWGYRLGTHKGEFDPNDFDHFSEEMYEYNKQDVEVTKALLERFEFKVGELDNDACVVLEHKFALYLQHQMAAGVCFDVEKAELLVRCWKKELSRRLIEMRAMVPDIIIEEEKVPKRDNKTKGWVKGVPYIKRTVVKFNPKSTDHLIFFFQTKYNWQPHEFTTKKSPKWPQGKPQVTHQVLADMTYPEAPLLARIKLLMDRIALVSGSAGSWIKSINPTTGRIHGYIVHNGTPTSRCRHSRPNLGNIPSTKATWGGVLRGLFKAQDGWSLLGCDADGLEMRLLSHYLFPFDNGAFFDAAFNGSKEEGTDCHSRNRDAINRELTLAGLEDLARVNRDVSKTIFYAVLYGAFPKKVASILIKMMGASIPPQRQYAIGQLIMNALRDSVVGLSELIASFEEGYEDSEQHGRWPHLYMPDGRPAPIRSKHSILNTANQTLGAVIMKLALVLFWEYMEEAGLKIRRDWNPLLFVHDELEAEIRPGTRQMNVGLTQRPHYEDRPSDEFARRLSIKAIEDAGKILKINVPLVGSASLGKCWADVH